MKKQQLHFEFKNRLTSSHNSPPGIHIGSIAAESTNLVAVLGPQHNLQGAAQPLALVVFELHLYLVELWFGAVKSDFLQLAAAAVPEV